MNNYRKKLGHIDCGECVTPMVGPLRKVVPVSTFGSSVTVYRLSLEDIERLLAAKYGEKLMAVNHARLARQNEKRARWLKSVGK